VTFLNLETKVTEKKTKLADPFKKKTKILINLVFSVHYFPIKEKKSPHKKNTISANNTLTFSIEDFFNIVLLAFFKSFYPQEKVKPSIILEKLFKIKIYIF